MRRARLGVGISNMEDRAAAFGLDAKIKGVLVENVEPGSPGAGAGLQPGDVITEFNGQAVTRSTELQRLVSRAGIGSTAQLKVLRGGRTITVSARLEELQEDALARTPAGLEEQGTASPRLGLRLVALTPELAQQYGIKARTGVVVAEVDDGSPAAAAGLQPGDVIERVAQTAVATPQEVQAAVQSILRKQSGAEKSVALSINRGGETSYVIIEVGQ